jgi:hypothetical protein
MILRRFCRFIAEGFIRELITNEDGYIIMGSIALIQKILGIALDGFTTVIVLQLFSSSTVMISLGIIGYYISK